MKAGAFRGATAWEWYVGPLWGRVNFPVYWLFSFNRLQHIRTLRAQGLHCKCYRCRAWLFAWPVSFGWDRG